MLPTASSSSEWVGSNKLLPLHVCVYLKLLISPYNNNYNALCESDLALAQYISMRKIKISKIFKNQ